MRAFQLMRKLESVIDTPPPATLNHTVCHWTIFSLYFTDFLGCLLLNYFFSCISPTFWAVWYWSVLFRIFLYVHFLYKFFSRPTKIWNYSISDYGNFCTKRLLFLFRVTKKILVSNLLNFYWWRKNYVAIKNCRPYVYSSYVKNSASNLRYLQN